MTSQAAVRPLTGPQRAAVLLLGLPPEQATRVVELLSEKEIQELSRAMSLLGEVDPTIAGSVFSEFNSRIVESSGIVGTRETTEKLLRSSLTGREELVETIMQEIRGTGGGSVWEKIATLDAKAFAAHIGREHPQTVAVVLSKILPDYAAQVLALLPAAAASDAMLRMLQLGDIPPDIMEDVERALRQDLATNFGDVRDDDPHAAIADLIGRVDTDTEARLLAALESISPERAMQVRRHMFTFADVAKMTTESLQVLLQDCDKARLAVALKTADDQTREIFTACMSERQAKMFREELETLKNTRKADAEAAQREIVLLAKALAAARRLTLRPEPDEAAEAQAAAS